MENRSAKRVFIIFIIGGLILWAGLVFADGAARPLSPLAGYGTYDQMVSGWSQQLNHVTSVVSKVDLSALAAWPFHHIPEVIAVIFLIEIGLILRDWLKLI